MQIPTIFTVSPYDQKGDVYGTEFTFNAALPSEYDSFAWTLGDGVTVYNKSLVTHTYNYPGIYTIGMSAWNDFGSIYTDSATVNVDYVYRDTILFSHIPSSYGTPGLPSDEPFTVSLTSAKIDQPLSIVLQAFNTNSVPHYSIPEKWRFLTPKWRFVDASTNQILDGPIVLSAVPIYKNSKVVAVKAEAKFYYIDDLSTGLDLETSCPLMIVATLSTEGFSYPPESLIYPYVGYSNSEVSRAVIAWQINDVVPTKLRITENFLNEVYPTKWAGVPIPVMITCEADTSVLESFADTASFSTAALSYPRTNELGSLFPVDLSLSYATGKATVDILSGGTHSLQEHGFYLTAPDGTEEYFYYNNAVARLSSITCTPEISSECLNFVLSHDIDQKNIFVSIPTPSTVVFRFDVLTNQTSTLSTDHSINIGTDLTTANIKSKTIIALNESGRFNAYADAELSNRIVVFHTLTSTNLSYTNYVENPNPGTNNLENNSFALTNFSKEIPSSSYTVEEAPLYFKAKDEYNNIASGYIFTTITPVSNIDIGSVVVKASTLASNQIASQNSFQFPVGYPIYPDVYVSHPAKGTVQKINVVAYSKSCASIEYYKNLGVLVEGQLSFVNVPILTSTNLINYTLSGTAAVYGMAFNPIKNRLYTCDVDQNLLTSYKSGTMLLSSVQLSSILQTETLAPSYISVDRYSNIWVSLFDDHKLLKFDSNLNYLLSAYPIIPIEEDFVSLDDGDTGLLLTEEGGSFIIERFGEDFYFVSPPIAETDMDSNVWACYSGSLSSMLVKFDSNGTEMLKASSLPYNSVPVSLAIDANNGVWVACKQANNLMLFDTNGSLVQTVSGFLRPSYIAMDRSNNVWVAHGYDLCSVYDTTTSMISTWRISTKPQDVVRVFDYTSHDIERALYEDEMWGGLATDVYNRIWVVDTLNSVAMTFNPLNPTDFRCIAILPPSDTKYVIKAGDNFVTDLPANNVRSAQAGGDWTGNRWYQKYTGNYNSSYIEGTSAPFKVYDLNNSFQIAKVNEEFNAANYFKSLALPEILAQNTKLFEEFFAAVVGDGDPTTESLGGVTYEKIANFVSNRGDFETSEIDELKSFAEQLSVSVRSYGKDFPVAINRLLNIFSVPKQHLRGVHSLETDYAENVGPLLYRDSLVIANKYYLATDKKYNTQQLVNAGVRNGLSAYPLELIEVQGFREPVVDNYYFSEYNTENTKGYVGNLINWDSAFTTISYNLSTNEEWYGDNGLVETMFNNLLTKQLYEQ